MTNNVITLPRDDVAKLMAAVADLEQTLASFGEFSFWTDGEYGRGGGDELTVANLFADSVDTLSRIASDIDQQVTAQ